MTPAKDAENVNSAETLDSAGCRDSAGMENFAEYPVARTYFDGLIVWTDFGIMKKIASVVAFVEDIVIVDYVAGRIAVVVVVPVVEIAA